MSAGPVIVAGAGHAGFQLAMSLRQNGFAERILLVNDEGHLPYQRPPLSKALLLGTAGRDTVFVHDDGWYDDHQIDLRTGVGVGAIDRSAGMSNSSTGNGSATTHCCWSPDRRLDRSTSPVRTSTG